VSFGTLGKGVFLHARWDRYSGYQHRQLWYGVYSTSLKSIRELATKVKAADGGKPIEHRAKHQSTNDHIWQLTTPLARSSMGVNVMELFPNARFPFFYGAYSKTCTTTTRLHSQEAVEETLDYFNYLRRIAAFHSGKGADEQRTRHIQIEQRIRNQVLPQRRKEQDGYLCKVCGMSYQKTYGALGFNFAECHHLIPLASRSSPGITRLDDLITVCANCHRMLHQMSGKRDDYLELKGLLRK
jgi:hypothetical protein